MLAAFDQVEDQLALGLFDFDVGLDHQVADPMQAELDGRRRADRRLPVIAGVGDARVVGVEVGDQLRPGLAAERRRVGRTVLRGDREVLDLPPIVVGRERSGDSAARRCRRRARRR